MTCPTCPLQSRRGRSMPVSCRSCTATACRLPAQGRPPLPLFVLTGNTGLPLSTVAATLEHIGAQVSRKEQRTLLERQRTLPSVIPARSAEPPCAYQPNHPRFLCEPERRAPGQPSVLPRAAASHRDVGQLFAPLCGGPGGPAAGASGTGPWRSRSCGTARGRPSRWASPAASSTCGPATPRRSRRRWAAPGGSCFRPWGLRAWRPEGHVFYWADQPLY